MRVLERERDREGERERFACVCVYACVCLCVCVRLLACAWMFSVDCLMHKHHQGSTFSGRVLFGSQCHCPIMNRPSDSRSKGGSVYIFLRLSPLDPFSYVYMIRPISIPSLTHLQRAVNSPSTCWHNLNPLHFVCQ